MNKRKKSVPEAYIFTRAGKVQWWQDGDRQGMIVAPTRMMAEQFAKWSENRDGRKVSIAEIGTLEGETLARQLDASVLEGANCAFLLQSVDENGVTALPMIRAPKGGSDDE